MRTLLVVSVFLLEYLDFSLSLDCSKTPKNKEVELRQKLFCNYDTAVRPTFDTKNATIVTIKPHILDYSVYETSETISLDTWVRMEWKDEHLKWKVEDYDGIKSLPVQGDEIWRPDLTSHHADNTQFNEACQNSHCVVEYTGDILCVPPCTFTGSCEVDFQYWPFDVIKCRIRLGTWVHKGEEVKFVPKGLFSYKTRHNEWKLSEVHYHSLRGNYSQLEKKNYTLPSIRYTLFLERYAVSEVVFIVSPALILAALNLVSLWLTPNCSERILLNITSMISHFLFLQQLSWLIPRNATNAPDALVYFRDSLVIATILLIDTIIKRGLLSCKSATPTWVKSTTDALRGNKIGQLMFENPYLINKVQLNNDSTPGDDFANLVEGQPTDETDTKQKTEDTNIWNIAVRVLDTLMFLALVIAYLIMIIGWIHLGPGKANLIRDQEDHEKSYIE